MKIDSIRIGGGIGFVLIAVVILATAPWHPHTNTSIICGWFTFVMGIALVLCSIDLKGDKKDED